MVKTLLNDYNHKPTAVTSSPLIDFWPKLPRHGFFGCAQGFGRSLFIFDRDAEESPKMVKEL